MMRALVEAGMDVARLNFSHGDYPDHETNYNRVRAASEVTGHAVGILADLQGPKIRLGRFADGPTVWVAGETIRITVDEFIRLHLDEKLTAEQAAMAKWWATEKQVYLIDRCLQLHGGYGYMREYPVARAYLDSRVQTIYGGTTEIMKEIIGRSVGV